MIKIVNLLMISTLVFSLISCEVTEFSRPNQKDKVEEVTEKDHCISPLNSRYASKINEGEFEVIQGEVSPVVEDHSDGSFYELLVFDALDGKSYMLDTMDPKWI